MRFALFLIAAIALLAVDSCTQVNAQVIDTPPANLTPGAKKIRVKLQTIIIESPSVPPEDLGETLSYLAIQSKERDPEHIGVQIVLKDTPPAKPLGNQTSDGKVHPIHRESEKWGEIPLGECIGAICQMTSHDYKITDDDVIVLPAKSQPPVK